MKIRCLLVDDEPIALSVLASYVHRIDALELAGQCQSAVECFSLLQSKPVDVIFLDIQMPQLSGLDLLRMLPNPPKVILTTAYREYALEGYELAVVDYLIKPVPFERFMKAVGKLFKQPPVVPVGGAVVQEEPFIFVREDRKLIRLVLRDIIWLESLRDYVKITTTTQQVTTRQTIGYFEALLPKEQFLRIHRSFMVAVAKIEAITESHLHLPGQQLAIGRYYKQQLLDRLQLRSIQGKLTR